MTMTKIGGHFQTTSEDTVELVRRLAVHYDDTTIALVLARQHRQTGTGLPFTKSRVKTLRVSRGIPAFQRRDCRTRQRGCCRGHRRRGRAAPGRRQGHHLPVAARRVPHRRAAHPERALADPDRPGRPRPRRSPRSPTAGSASIRPPRSSASPARPCCTRSSAVSLPRSTSTADAEKACVSTSGPTRLDCSTSPDERHAQC